MQGVVLWLLYEAVQGSLYRIISTRVLGAALYAAVAGPLAWYLSHGAFTSERRRLTFAMVAGAVFSALGAHVGALSKAAYWVVSYVFAAAVLEFVTIVLVGGWDATTKRFEYRRLFELACRNAVLLGVVLGLTGALWIVLFAGAWLMQSIGIKGLIELYRKPAFAIIVSATAVGLAFGLALARADMLVSLRRFALSLAMWFLPLALVFAVAWVIALPFTGVQPLFSTGNAALYLLWFGTLAIVFLNAGFQDGRERPLYPRWLAKSLVWAWLAMPLLTLLAGWALWQRIAQHGWTPERIWAAVVWAIVTLDAFGYALSVRGGAWMGTVARTNIVAALVKVVVIVALISPIADLHRLTVASQVHRLRSGAVDPTLFDWNLLSRQTGEYGLSALRNLAANAADDVRSKLIAKQASDTLRFGASTRPPALQDSDVALAALRERIAVRPRGAVPDAALLQWLARSDADWDERNCIAHPDFCALWLIDLDQDGNAEAVLLREQAGIVQSTLYARGPHGWRKEGPLYGPTRTLSTWLADIDNGRVAIAPPRWPDLSINGERVRVGR